MASTTTGPFTASSNYKGTGISVDSHGHLSISSPSSGSSSSGSIRSSPITLAPRSTPAAAISNPPGSGSPPQVPPGFVATAGGIREEQPSFFSIAGQKLAFQRVVGTLLSPFSNEKISVLGYTSPVVSGAVKATVGIAEAGSIAYGAALGASALGMSGAAPAAAVTGAAVPAAAAGSLRNYAIAAGAGAIGGYLLAGNGSQRQDIQQSQQPSGTSSPHQSSTWNDNSIRTSYQDQYTTYEILGSPGASIAGNPLQSASQPSNFTPSQTAPFSMPTGQSAEPSQTSMGSLLIPALIVGAALILSKK